MNYIHNFKDIFKKAMQDNVISFAYRDLYVCSQKIANSTYNYYKGDWDSALLCLVGTDLKKVILIFSIEALQTEIEKLESC